MRGRPAGGSAREGFTLIEMLVVVALIGLLALVGVRGLFLGPEAPLETLQKLFADGRREAVDGGETLVLRLSAGGELGLYPLAEPESLRSVPPPDGAAWRLEPEALYFFSDGAVTPGKVFLDSGGERSETFWITVTGQVVPQE